MELKWHDCKTDPPKKSGEYLVIYKYTNRFGYGFDRNGYALEGNATNTGNWEFNEYTHYIELISWAEIDLLEIIKKASK